MRQNRIRSAVIGSLLAVALAALPAIAQIPPDAQIRMLLTSRLGAQASSIGIVVGVIEPHGRRVVAYGSLDKGDSRAFDGDTVFEIGSVTKVFTSLLLADMVRRGEVALDDPVAKYLPAGVRVPERGGRRITLVDLATHTSGLPRLPSNLSPKDPANPYADYSPEQLYQFLSGYTLTRDIGSKYEYSNLGVGLLGHALARRAGMDYESLVRTRILGPLGMHGTAVTLSAGMKARLAVGHNASLATVANWDLPTLAGAGALRSTANDMLTFLAAHLGYVKSPLQPAMADMLAVRRPTGTAGLEIALGWHVTTSGGEQIVWHNGATGGYASFVAFDRKKGIGVVVLSNGAPADSIGYQLLEGRQHTEVAVNPALLDLYVGRYQLVPGVAITVTREANQLRAQLTGQPRFEVYPESDRSFFFKVVEAQLVFDSDGKHPATALTLHQNGLDQRATRMEGQPAPPKEHKQVAVAPATFDGYAGRYQLAPAFILTVTREGAGLFVQATGQPKFEVFPESPRDFFLKVVDAQITFETDAHGRATALVLHQNGLDQRALRIP